MTVRFDIVFAAGLLSGTTVALALPQALPAMLSWVLVLSGTAVFLRLPRWRLLAGAAIGMGWATLIAVWVMEERLPAALEGEDLVVEGQVLGLPLQGRAQTRFEFKVSSAFGAAQVLEGRRLRLSWYRSGQTPAPGSTWRLAVRLKRPRGTLNPGGQDYERTALERRIAAGGYVRDDPLNAELSPASGIDALRLRLSDAIAEAVNAPRGRFVQALAVGDTRALDETDWQVLRATGTAHLIAISGLHVGIAAGFGALLMRFAYRRWPRCGLMLPLPQAAALAALLLAAGYSALAGFALPTVRALLMISAALLGIVLRRAFTTVQAFALALIVVLLMDPLAVLNAGFWLSFLGVAWLLWCLPQARGHSWWRALVSVQGVMTLGLLPLTVWFFGQASLAGPLCNLVAVPWTSVAVVPMALLGALLELLATGAGTWLFRLSAWLMDGLWRVMEPVAAWHGALVYLPAPSSWAFVAALVGAFFLLLPRGLPGKPLALFLFAPLLFPALPRPPAGSLDLSVLDVGQGLSVLLRTQNHAVLYDAGPAFPGGMDMGSAAVVPALRALGVAQLDLLLLSHDDNDHSGGVASVKRAYAPARTVVSRRQPDDGEVACQSGMGWEFDGVSLRVLHPPEFFPYLDNESSCVLRVETPAGGVVLLPGDIGTIIEQRLVREQPGLLPAPVLLLPHHGSLSSSSEGFIDAVSPQLGLIGAGHRNRYRLPREDVVARYRQRGIKVLNTAETGAIHVRASAEGVQDVRSERQLRPAIWREQ